MMLKYLFFLANRCDGLYVADKFKLKVFTFQEWNHQLAPVVQDVFSFYQETLSN